MTKRAVIVGINDYSQQLKWPDGQTMWSSLSFCRADADAVYHLMLDAFGFDPAGITLLTDQAASSANIRRAVAHMLAASEPGDVALFSYSGHGGLHPGATPDTYYQTIIPATGRWISDWDLWQAADALNPSEVNLTIVMDSCHSGGMADPVPDGPAAKTTALAQDEMIKILSQMHTVVPIGIVAPDIETLSNNVAKVLEAPGPVACYTEEANRELAPSAKATLFSAARWDESARELGALGHGVFTKALLEVVDACPFLVSNQELHSRLHEKVREVSAPIPEELRQSPVLRVQANRASHTFLEPFVDSR
ncbi:MAG: caspase family protein [Arachnia sp.]